MVSRSERNHPGRFGTRLGVLAVAAALITAACASSSSPEASALVVGSSPATPETTAAPAKCADVVDATIVEASGTFRISATILSPDTGWEKYADAWEVRAPDGTVLGTRILAHPHVDEQPFTRSLSGVVIPDSVVTVELAARDLVEGFCGPTFELAVPGR